MSRILKLAGALTLAIIIIGGAAAAPKKTPPKFLPLASGPLGDVNAKDGDSGFYAEYFAAPNPAGAPLTGRLEATPGAAPAPGALAGKAHAARWTATLTPRRTGNYTFALRSIGASILKLDGKRLLSRPAASTLINYRTLATAPLETGKPYEVVVELRDPTGKGQIAVEWSPPTATATPEPQRPSTTEAVAGPAPGTRIGAPATLQNDAYRLDSQEDGTLLLTERASGAAARFAPEFAVVCQPPGRQSKLDAKGGKYQDDGPVGATNYLVPSWDKETDFLAAAHPRTRLRAASATLAGNSLHWTFPAQPACVLTAEVALPPGAGEPSLTFHLQTTAPGQFSVGYVGAPAATEREAQWIWQPLVWQDRRFPNKSYLTKEFECPLPFVMLGREGLALGVGADPAEMPYRMPTNQDSRFGVLLRAADGRLQPMLFAPVLGGPESAMPAGRTYSFALRLFAGRGPWFGAFKHLAQTLYHFSDIRESGLCSLNTTLDNMVDFLLTDRFAYWYPKHKCWGYQNDSGPGAGRQQSAADALGVARVRDNADFFRRRALPTLEYLLSRKSAMIKMEEPGTMGVGCGSPADLAAVYRLTGGRATPLRERLAKTSETLAPLPSPGSPREITTLKTLMLDGLVQYRLTGDKAFLQAALAAADRYIAVRIAQPAENFKDLGSSFWNELAPPFDILYELYAESGQRKYLAAAAAAMRQFTAFVYMVPLIPPGDFTANPGGTYNGQSVPEEMVPAWRVSANGLTAECAGTAHSHRGVFMASYPALMARLARDTSETFFLDIARNAVVGRYANYPSYAYRNGYSTVYEKADYPLRSFEEIKKFTSAHYNHPLPMAAFLIDYLVSEGYNRSGGRIDFPAEYTNTGAYFRNRVYGARPGHFYDETGVNLWLPKGLVRCDSIQLNYVAGYGNGKLYLALANQSRQPVDAQLEIDPGRVGLKGLHRARVWIDNREAESLIVAYGRAAIRVSSKGLTCLAIENAPVHTELQAAMSDPSTTPLPPGSAQTIHTPFGDVTATALRFGKGLTSVHVWLTAGPPEVKQATLTCTVGGGRGKETCAQYPFEFTVPIPDDAPSFQCTIEAETNKGTLKSEAITLPLQ